MFRLPRLPTIGIAVFGAAAMLPWPDGSLRAALSGPLAAAPGQAGGSIYLSYLATVAALFVMLTLLRRIAPPVQRPAPARRHAGASAAAVPLPEPARSHRERLAWHQLAAAVDHLSDSRRQATDAGAAPCRPLSLRAQAMHGLIARPEETLRRTSADLGRTADALLRRLHD
ncbi:hypothetical protein ACFOGJ_27760 [Marinibaculum pumilum]|uniref:Uncharacterized protein n=1 Tax=Marinibaculum pumilum TaxID=1766165 RepID=A0ABV7L9V6_9PROT